MGNVHNIKIPVNGQELHISVKIEVIQCDLQE